MEQILSGGKLGEEEERKGWSGSSGTQKIDREIDLKGKVCPYTFIESMLALEDMKVGEVLRVIVDYPPAVCDVPKSLKSEGYEILDVSAINNTDWAILVRNREFEE
jgi:tRNA 2-thiouridine synthesizing protein A